MQPTRSLDDIIASLNSVYQPQIGLIQKQQAALPQQAQAQVDALGAKKDQAFGDILNGARQRGLGFSGIPLGDQAKYLSTDYAPALANLQTASTNQATSLQQAILQLQQQQNTQGQSIYQSEQDRAATLAAARAQADAQNAAYKGLFGGGGGNGGTPSGPPAVKSSTMVKRGDGGFNFVDAGGKAISAAQFAASKGIPFRTLLQEMANEGDAGAKAALGFVGNDYGYNPTKITNPSLAALYNSLVWGTGHGATYNAPAPSVHNQVINTTKSVGNTVAKSAPSGFVTQPDISVLKQSLANARAGR